MDREIALAKSKPGGEDIISQHRALVLSHAGHLQESRAMWRRAVQFAQQAGDRGRAGLYESAAAVSESVFGNALLARERAKAAIDLSRGRDVEYAAAFALAFSGDPAGSQALADDLDQRFPEDTAVRFTYLPTLRASCALARGDSAQAIELLESTRPHDLDLPGTAFVSFFGGLYPVYVRGEAYLASHQYQKAAAEFQKILDHRGIVLSDPTGALAHLQLGRALALGGDMTKGKSAYADFLAIWKDADPDIPILQQAKLEYARLFNGAAL